MSLAVLLRAIKGAFTRVALRQVVWSCRRITNTSRRALCVSLVGLRVSISPRTAVTDTGSEPPAPMREAHRNGGHAAPATGRPGSLLLPASIAVQVPCGLTWGRSLGGAILYPTSITWHPICRLDVIALAGRVLGLLQVAVEVVGAEVALGVPASSLPADVADIICPKGATLANPTARGVRHACIVVSGIDAGALVSCHGGKGGSLSPSHAAVDVAAWIGAPPNGPLLSGSASVQDGLHVKATLLQPPGESGAVLAPAVPLAAACLTGLSVQCAIEVGARSAEQSTGLQLGVHACVHIGDFFVGIKPAASADARALLATAVELACEQPAAAAGSQRRSRPGDPTVVPSASSATTLPAQPAASAPGDSDRRRGVAGRALAYAPPIFLPGFLPLVPSVFSADLIIDGMSADIVLPESRHCLHVVWDEGSMDAAAAAAAAASSPSDGAGRSSPSRTLQPRNSLEFECSDDGLDGVANGEEDAPLPGALDSAAAAAAVDDANGKSFVLRGAEVLAQAAASPHEALPRQAWMRSIVAIGGLHARAVQGGAPESAVHMRVPLLKDGALAAASAGVDAIALAAARVIDPGAPLRPAHAPHPGGLTGSSGSLRTPPIPAWWGDGQPLMRLFTLDGLEVAASVGPTAEAGAGAAAAAAGPGGGSPCHEVVLSAAVAGIAADVCEDLLALAGAGISVAAAARTVFKAAHKAPAKAAAVHRNASDTHLMTSAGSFVRGGAVPVADESPLLELSLPVRITAVEVRGIAVGICGQGPHYTAASAPSAHSWPAGHALASGLGRRHALVLICLPSVSVEVAGLSVWRRRPPALPAAPGPQPGNPQIIATLVGGAQLRGPLALRATAQLTVSHPVALVPEDDDDIGDGDGEHAVVPPRHVKPGVPCGSWEDEEEGEDGVADGAEDGGGWADAIDGDVSPPLEGGDPLGPPLGPWHPVYEQGPAPMHEAVRVETASCAWQVATPAPPSAPGRPAVDPWGSGVIDLKAADVALIFSDHAFPSIAAAVRAVTCWNLRYVVPATHALKALALVRSSSSSSNASGGSINGGDAEPVPSSDAGFGPILFRKLFQARGPAGELLGHATAKPPVFHVLRGVRIPSALASSTASPNANVGDASPSDSGGFCTMAPFEATLAGTDLAAGPPRRFVWHHHSCLAGLCGSHQCRAAIDDSEATQAAVAPPLPPLFPPAGHGDSISSDNSPRDGSGGAAACGPVSGRRASGGAELLAELQPFAGVGPGRPRYPLQVHIVRMTIAAALRSPSGRAVPPASPLRPQTASSGPARQPAVPPLATHTAASAAPLPPMRRLPWYVFSIASLSVTADVAVPGPGGKPQRPLRLAPCAFAGTRSVLPGRGDGCASPVAPGTSRRGSVSSSSRLVRGDVQSTGGPSTHRDRAAAGSAAPVTRIDVPYAPPDAFCMAFSGIAIDALPPAELDRGSEALELLSEAADGPPPPAARDAAALLVASRAIGSVHRVLEVDVFAVDMSALPLLRSWAPAAGAAAAAAAAAAEPSATTHSDGAGAPAHPLQVTWQPLVDLVARRLTISAGSDPDFLVGVVYAMQTMIRHVPGGVVLTIQRGAAASRWAERLLAQQGGQPAAATLRLSDALRYNAAAANPPATSTTALAQVRGAASHSLICARDCFPLPATPPVLLARADAGRRG